MDFHHFERRAQEIFAEIPAQYREGIDGLEVTRETVAHPSLPDIYTLGECKTEQYPSEFGGAGEVRSIVAIYYGSFLALSRLDDEWDWEGELFETVTHEVRHHLESLAIEDELEEIDYAEDQNFARREGEPFDPSFYRYGMRRAEREWEVDGDFFLEIPVGPDAETVEVNWRDRIARVAVPAEGEGDRFVLIEEWSEEFDVVAVLLRRRGWLSWLRGLLGRRSTG